MENETDVGVPTLGHLAFHSFYNQLVCKATDAESTEFVRSCIHNQLMGVMRKKIRGECIAKYNKSCCIFEEKQKLIIPDISIILDCLLDDSFTELKIYITEPFFHSFSTLMSIIAQRAPNLKELDIQFIGYNQFKSVETLILPYHPSPLLSSLEILTLNHCGKRNHHWCWSPIRVPLSGDTHYSFLSVVGKVCPKLVKLNVTGFCLTEFDIVGLVLGELAQNIFPRDGYGLALTEDSHRWMYMFESLLIPPYYLSPLCLTLEETRLECACYWCGPHSSESLDSIFAFALRYLSKLRKFDAGDWSAIVGKAIKTLDKTELQKLPEFEKACEEAALAIGLKKDSIDSPPSNGVLLPLRELELSLNVSGTDAVRAVGKCCRHLERVCFSETVVADDESDPFYNMTEGVCKTEFESILKECWTETLRSIRLDRFLWIGFTDPILKVFGKNLTSLELENGAFDMELLGPCTQLKQLTIEAFWSRSVENKPSDSWTHETFLPLLTELKSNICLGDWAPLFEKKSTLIRLQLNCCHIGTPAYNPRLEWDQVPELWPNLKSVDIGQCSTGLSVTKLAVELVPKMKVLENIRFPDTILSKDEEELAIKLIQDMYKIEPVKGSGLSTLGYHACRFLRNSSTVNTLLDEDDYIEYLDDSDEYS